KIRTVKTVGRVGRVVTGKKPLRMLDDPRRVDAHVVWHHVAGKPNPESPCLIAQADICVVAAKIVRNTVVIERIGRSNRILFAAKMLDRTRSAAPLPKPDEPQRVHAPASQRCQLFVRYLVEPRDGTPI